MATIVFINEEEQSVMIVENKTVQILDWSQIGAIASMLDGKEIYYVTSAEYVSGNSIISLLTELAPIESRQVSTLRYLRSKMHGHVIVPGAGGDSFTFKGPTDFWPVDKLGSDFMDRYPMVKQLLSDGKMEFVNDYEKNRIIAEFERKRAKLSGAAKDKALDQMLVKTSVDDFLKNKDDDDDSDVISIEVNGGASFKRDQEQETYSNLRSIGRTVED